MRRTPSQCANSMKSRMNRIDELLLQMWQLAAGIDPGAASAIDTLRRETREALISIELSVRLAETANEQEFTQ